MGRLIMHIDLNAFYATAEEIRNPALRGKPILIGHEGRSGIVSTASYAARRKGCHSGQPTFQALRLCPEAVVIQPDFHYYEVLSLSFFAYLSSYSHLIEKASIDEAYVDMTKPLLKAKDPVAYLRAMQLDLKAKTGLSCSIGLAKTKWLAKMGSDLHKPLGLTIIRQRDIEKIIYPLPIESFWGIGKKTAPELREKGCETIGDLASRLKEGDEEIYRLLGKFAYTCLDWVRGKGDDEIVVEPEEAKSIGNSTTLSRDCSGFDEVSPEVRKLSEEVARRAKEAKKAGLTLTLSVKDTQFRMHSRSKTFEEPLSEASTIYAEAESLYRKSFEAMDVRLVGISLSKLVNPLKRTVQMTIWNYEEYENADKTRKIINEINRKLSKPLLKRGSEAERKGGKGDGH